MKEYKYLGYTFRATNTIHANSGRYLYEIDDLKERGERPFLTTIDGCQEYIRQHGKLAQNRTPDREQDTWEPEY